MKNVQPSINVTPLIDVLLVLLIIFMVISPAKPTDFKTKIPSPPNYDGAKAHPDTLIVTLNSDSTLSLNKEANLGTSEQPDKLIERLSGILRQRRENQVYSRNSESSVETTVFIKAPRSLNYGTVIKVVDSVKTAGASPIGLQIDDLN